MRTVGPGILVWLLASSLVTACAGGEGTGPKSEGPEIDLRVVHHPPPILEGEAWDVRLSCEVGIEAVARGAGETGWQGATFELFAGIDRSVAIDTFTLTREEVIFAWSRETITAQQPDTTYWTFSAAIPFAVRAKFQHRVPTSDRERSSTVDFTCGPIVTPDAAPPSITHVDVSGANEVIEAGDTVRVHYTYVAASSAWRSAVAMRGPFEAFRYFADNLSGGRDRTVEFVVPRLAPLGVPLRAEVQVMDAVGRIIDTVFVSTTVISDVTRPRMGGLVATPGQWGTGQSFRILAYGHDNHELRWMHYQLDDPLGHHDSTRVGDILATDPQELEIVVRPEWAGLASGVKVWVTDAKGLSSDTLASAPATYRFYQSIERAPSAVGHLFGGTSPGYSPTELLLDEPNSRLHVRMGDAQRITSFDIASFTPLSALQMLWPPFSMDLTVSRDSLLIATPHLRSIQVLDLRTRQFRDAISLAGILDSAAGGQGSMVPIGAQVTSAGRVLVQFDGTGGGNDRLLELDLATGSQRFRVDARTAGPVSTEGNRLGSTPDKSRIYVMTESCRRVYTVATDDFGPCMSPNAELGRGWSFAPVASRMVVGRSLLGLDLSFVQELGAQDIVLAPDGLVYFQAVGNSVACVRISDGRFLYRVMLPFAPYRLILLADGATLLVVSYEGRIARVNVGPP